MTAIAGNQREQAMRALAGANDIRMHIAGFKRDVAGRNYIDALRVLCETIENASDPLMGAAKVRQLLMAVKWIGPEKSVTYMLGAGITDRDVRLRDLDKRKRDKLVHVLEQMAWRRQ